MHRLLKEDPKDARRGGCPAKHRKRSTSRFQSEE